VRSDRLGIGGRQRGRHARAGRGRRMSALGEAPNSAVEPPRAFDPEAPADQRHHHHPLAERVDFPVAIAVDDVSKVFGSKDRQTTALDHVSFQIRVGEFVSLLGPSGCGKSTLLRLVSALETPSGGTINVNGLAAIEARRKRLFGIVFQSPVLFDWRTVEENVSLPLQVMREPKATIKSRVAELLELVGLSEFRTHY